MSFARRVFRATVSVGVFIAGALRAQSVTPELAVGVAVPSATLGKHRTLGPLLRGAITLGDPRQRHVRLRLELETSWLMGRDATPSPALWNYGTLRAVSGIASVVVGPTQVSRVGPYFLLGLAAERLSVTGVTNPYGNTAALRVGAGLRWGLGARTMFVETAPHFALTDFGTASDFSAGVRIPIMLGVRF